MTETRDPEPTEGPKRDWRPWEASRTEKQRALRVDEVAWNDYEAVCNHDETNRNADINAFIRRRIKAFRRKHPDKALPSDARQDADA